MTSRLLTASEVGELLGFSTATILRWSRTGKLPSIQMPGGAIRFQEDQLDTWLVERATPRRGVVTHPAGRRPAST